MTREEAIIVLKYGMKYRNPKNDTEKDRNEALDMAISALSEQKSLKERMEQLYLVESLKEDFENLIKENERLRNALSKNKGEWIPVNERLPEDYDRVLITVNGCRGLIVREAHYHKARNEFEVLHNHDRWEVGEEGLLAWQPLPEPYKAESEDK